MILAGRSGLLVERIDDNLSDIPELDLAPYRGLELDASMRYTLASREENKRREIAGGQTCPARIFQLSFSEVGAGGNMAHTVYWFI